MRYLSLFSGMEAAHIAWSALGWQCAGVAEIDPAACALLRHRLPQVPNLGSVTDISAEAIAKLGRIDVVIGGSPCQDWSVAGKRAGLAGERSSLFHEQLRIFNAARTFCGARWFVWENVPGAFSSNAGRDFAVVVGAMAGCELDVPADGWGNEGLALGDSGLVEWSVLDSQWFGVAQRRRRVFAVLDTGDWAGRPPVLLEPESLRGDSAPCRESGEGTAGCAARSVALRGREGGGTAELGDEVAGTLRASTGGGDKPYALLPELARCDTTGEGERQDWETCTFIPAVAHTLRTDGFDASEDGTGRGTPLVPVQFDTTQITSASNYSNPRPGDPCHPLCAGAHPPAIASGCKDSDPARSVSADVSPTLRAMGHAESHANAGGQVAVAYTTKLHNTQSNNAGKIFEERAPCLDASSPAPALLTPTAVRRLTPRECERLQAAPDDWTLVPKLGKPRKQRKNEPDLHYADYLAKHSGGVDGGPMMADGPRYKMLGNSFTATVIRWIGRKIECAHAVASELREAA